jgi:hypothetical protein
MIIPSNVGSVLPMSVRPPPDPPEVTSDNADGINYERMYDYRFRDVNQASRLAVWAKVARFVYAEMSDPERVLDPAAGRGEFITAVPAAERWGVDRVKQADLEASGVRMVIADIMDTTLPGDYFDGVFLSNFLEHLPTQDTVATVLGKLRSAMAPGGKIAIIGPNFRYCAREYFDCADHNVALSHVAVAEHLYAAGFELVKVVPRFLPYSFRGRLPSSALLADVYLRCPVLWRLLGKQFFIVARK